MNDFEQVPMDIMDAPKVNEGHETSGIANFCELCDSETFEISVLALN